MYYGAIVLATGYRYDEFNQILRDMEPLMTKDKVERSYRMPMQDNCSVNAFLQRCCEASHGLSDTLFSVLAQRSQEIVEALLVREKKPKEKTRA